MGKHYKLLIALFLGMSVCASPVFGAEHSAYLENAISKAQAVPHESGKSGYVEYYLDEPLSDVVRASYRSADGKELASKQLNFTEESKHPAFELLDYRSSSGYKVVPQDGKLRVLSLRLLENNMRAVVDVREVTIVEPMVVDAGFHRFLLNHWDDIAAGSKVRFNFLQVDRARLVPLIVSRAACSNKRHYCIRVSLGNFFLRVLLPSVELTYDASSKRLLSYSGLGPLPTESGSALAVSLNYEYLQ